MATLPDCTLTTGCFLLQKYHAGSRSLADTLQGMEALLAVPCYLVIYCNQPLYDHIVERRRSYHLESITRVILMEVEDLWAYQFADKIRANREVYWPTRDARISVESTVIVFNKFNFVLRTIEQNPFGTSRVGWIDGSLGVGGSKICRDGQLSRRLVYVLNNISERFHLQVLNVEDKKFLRPENKREYYSQARWVAVGCLFTCSERIGRPILQRLQEVIRNTIQQGFGHHEEYTMLELQAEFPEDIHCGYGDYQDTLENLLVPTTNLVYVYWQIVMKYYYYGYHRECEDVCKAIIESFDEGLPDPNMDLYVRIWSVRYLSMMRHDAVRGEEFGNRIRASIKTHPLFAHHFYELKYLIGMEGFEV
jgi:hypothetical protein